VFLISGEFPVIVGYLTIPVEAPNLGVACLNYSSAGSPLGDIRGCYVSS
jgi:hypothetical protein